MRKYLLIILSFLLFTQLIAQEADSYILRARVYMDAGNAYKALEECSDGLQVVSDYRLVLIKANALVKVNRLEEAEMTYRQANTLSIGSGDLGLAKIYALKGDNNLAVSHLRSHLESDFKLPRRDILLDKQFRSIENDQEWKSLWSVDWYTSLEDGLAEASYLVEHNRKDELKELMNFLEPQYSDMSDFEFIAAQYYKVIGNKALALDYFRKSLEKDMSSKEKWLGLIDGLEQTGSFYEAATKSSEARKYHPGERVFIIKGASNLHQAGDREGALMEIEQFLKLVPDSESGLALAGDIELESREYSKALRYYSLSIELYPGNPDHYIKRGNTYSLTSTWEYAISDYSMALDLKPDDGGVYYSKAMALLKTQKSDDACRNFRMALKYGNTKAASEINKHCIR